MTASTVYRPLRSDADLAARLIVVMPTLNEAASIAACLQSLLNMDYASALEVIVADGGSTDGTRQIVEELSLRYPGLRLMVNPDGHQAGAVNLAARLADPGRDILIRCDAHALYPEGFLLGVAHSLLDTGADSLVVPMDAVAAPGAGSFAEANAFIVDTPLGSGGSAHRGGQKSGWVDHGHHAAFFRQRFLDLGGYDPAMVGNEDAEYDTRLRKAGGRIWLDPYWRIRYFPRNTVRGLFRQYRRYGAARARHVFHHGVRPRLRQMVPVGHVLAMAGSLALAGVTALALVYPALYLAVMLIATIWALGKTGKPSMLYVPVALATMHTAWGLGFLAESIRARSQQT